MSLPQKIIDRISDEVMSNVEISVHFERLVREMVSVILQDKSFEKVIKEFDYDCGTRLSCYRIDKPRKELRKDLQDHFDSTSHSIHRSIERKIDETLRKHESDMEEQFVKYARPYLRDRFLPKSPPPPPLPENADEESSQAIIPDRDIDMDIDSSAGDESPKAPEFSPISNPDNDSMDMKLAESDAGQPIVKNSEDHKQPSPHDNNQDHPGQPCSDQTNNLDNNQPSLDDIPIPPEEDCPTPVEDEQQPPQVEDRLSLPIKQLNEHNNDDDELNEMTFSDVSSVHTADLSDFDESIKLSDDEANIVGRPRNTKIPIKILQGTISDLQQTKSANCHQEQSNTKQQSVTIKKELQEHNETGESDGFVSDGTTNTGRRATRTRKSNPRYSNEHFTL